jgi:hypothetical protein
LVLSRVHDCIGILMGDHRKYQAYFENHPGVYYRSPGWIEFQAPGQWLQPAEVSTKNTLLTYISTGVGSDDGCRNLARAEADREGWTFDEVHGSLALLQRLVDGEWDPENFLVVPPGATILAASGDSIVTLQ